MHRQLAGLLTGRVTKWIVLVSWLVIAVGSSVFAQRLTDVQDNQASSFLPTSAESTRVLDELSSFRDQDDLPTVVVYERSSGLTPDDLAAIESQASTFSDLDGVTGDVLGPVVSADGQAAQSVVTYNFGSDGFLRIADAVDELRDRAGIPGVAVHIAGSGGQAADSASAFAGIDGVLLLATLGVVIVILLFTYRSPVLWILPIVSAVVALFTTEAVVYFLARYADLTVNGQSQGILTVLVIGAGTDYALLLVARYREELHRHEDRHEAMAFALHRAAPALLASAGTVAVGMLCLLFAEMSSTKGLGPVNAIGIAVTFLVMVTLLPALLVIFGRWIFWPRRPAYSDKQSERSGLWARVGARIAPRPRVVWVGTTVVLLIACLGLFRLDAHGLDTAEQYTTEVDSVTGQNVLLDHGLTNSSDPVLVVAAAGAADQVRTAMSSVDGLSEPSPPAVQGDLALVAATVDGDTAGQAAFDTVVRTRAAVREVEGADALVGGTSAIYLDIQQASARDNRVIIPIVLAVVLLILMLLLRALVSPLLLMLTVVLSFGAALGISTLLFTYVFGFEGADASFPLFVFVFLVALGIDYNIFLMTRVREETATRGTRQGSLVALAATGGVITSAGVVLAATFAVLGTIPLVFLAELGVAVALGVLLDTLVVRSVLVTALNLDLGARIWWPSSLDRRTDDSADVVRELA